MKHASNQIKKAQDGVEKRRRTGVGIAQLWGLEGRVYQQRLHGGETQNPKQKKDITHDKLPLFRAHSIPMFPNKRPNPCQSRS